MIFFDHLLEKILIDLIIFFCNISSKSFPFFLILLIFFLISELTKKVENISSNANL